MIQTTLRHQMRNDQHRQVIKRNRLAFHALPPAPKATPMTIDTARQWLTGFTRAAFARAKAELWFQPVRRAILDDSELVAVGAIDELFHRLALFLKETTMANDQAKAALKAAGCPDEHCEQAAAMGLTAADV